MIPRSARIQKERKQKRKKRTKKTLQSGIVLSSLLVASSQMIGSTYGYYSSTAKQDIEINACEVFPDYIENLLVQLKEHAGTLNALAKRLHTIDYSQPSSPKEFKERDNPEKVDETVKQIENSISQLNTTIERNNRNSAKASEIWGRLIQEANAIQEILIKLHTYTGQVDPNCLELNDSGLLRDLQSLLDDCPLNQHMRAGTLEIIKYFLAVKKAAPTDLGQSGSNQITQSREEIIAENQLSLSSNLSTVVSIDNGLQQFYESLQSSINAANNKISGSLQELSSLKAEIIASAKKKEEEKQAAKDSVDKGTSDMPKQDESNEDKTNKDGIDTATDNSGQTPGAAEPATPATPDVEAGITSDSAENAAPQDNGGSTGETTNP